MKYSKTVRDLAANVVAGAPHAKVPYSRFLGLTQQAYKVTLSVRLLLEISQRGNVFRL